MTGSIDTRYGSGLAFPAGVSLASTNALAAANPLIIGNHGSGSTTLAQYTDVVAYYQDTYPTTCRTIE